MGNIISYPPCSLYAVMLAYDYMVEPLLMNFHLTSLYKGQDLWSLQDHNNTMLPLKEDNLCITVTLHQNNWSQGVA